MIQRRGFLAGMLALGTAPGIITSVMSRPSLIVSRYASGGLIEDGSLTLVGSYTPESIITKVLDIYQRELFAKIEAGIGVTVNELFRDYDCIEYGRDPRFVAALSRRPETRAYTLWNTKRIKR